MTFNEKSYELIALIPITENSKEKRKEKEVMKTRLYIAGLAVIQNQG